MENLIIQNLLEQIEKLKEENKKLTEENNRLKNNTEECIIKETPQPIIKEKYKSENMLKIIADEKFTNPLNINEFEILLKTKITENDLFDCVNKDLKDVVINVLTRELSNIDIRPIHKNNYYVIRIDDEWVNKTNFDFNKAIKRLINIVVHTMGSIFINLKKTVGYKGGVLKYKMHNIDVDNFTVKIMDDINYNVVYKSISNFLHIKL